MQPIHLSGSDFKPALSKGVTLVDFWAEWCGPCKMIAPIIEELADDFAGRAVVAKLDTDAHAEVAVSLGISAIPTVIVFKDGAEAKRLVGTQPKEVYAEALNSLLSAQ